MWARTDSLGPKHPVRLPPLQRFSGVASRVLSDWRETYDIEAKASADAVPESLAASEKTSAETGNDPRVPR